jgi:HK97 family phage major capsid protein
MTHSRFLAVALAAVSIMAALVDVASASPAGAVAIVAPVLSFGGVAFLAAGAAISRYMPRVCFDANPDPIALAAALKTAADDVKKIGETVQTEIKNLGKETAESKQKADEALIKHNEIAARLQEIEQKLVRDHGSGPEKRKTAGQFVTEHEDVKALLKSKRGKVSIGIDSKAIISALTTDANGSAGDLIVPDRRPGMVTPPQRRMTVRDLLTPGNTNSNAIQYVKETGFTNSAATVSETAGSTKPQSEIKFDIATTAVSTIAHWVLATKQILDDVPMLQSYIDGRLRYGLAYAEELQLLMGAGTGTDLNGVYTQATAYSAPATISSPTQIDIIRLAMLQAFLAEYPPNGIVLNPIDWAVIELLKDTTGRYIIGNPQGAVEKRLWNLPVVDTPAMTEDKFLVGAFQLGAQIFDREDANVEISTEDSDNFRKNLVTVRAEERLALAVYRPESFIKGDLGRVA